MKRVAILQSNYIPWKGYFDIINSVDEFIIYDEMQYTRSDWRNRNRVKTFNGPVWLTIPVSVKGNYVEKHKIRETRVIGNWYRKHWNTIKIAYSNSPFFAEYAPVFEEFYVNRAPALEFLSDINVELIKIINDILGIKTKISLDIDYGILDEGKSDRVLDLCLRASGTTYVSGPAAKDYLECALFDKKNVIVEWMDYSSYPEYNQPHPPFEHSVSVLDLIFSEGPNAHKFMKTFK